MIIKITQTKSNVQQEFKVDYGGERGQGKLGSFLNEQKIILNCDNEEYVGKFLITELLHCIPFLNWFGFNRKTKNFAIYKNGEYSKIIKEIIPLLDNMAKRTGSLWEYTLTGGSCNHGFTFFCDKVDFGRILWYN